MECYRDKINSTTSTLESLVSECAMRDDSYIQTIPGFCTAVTDLGKIKNLLNAFDSTYYNIANID